MNLIHSFVILALSAVAFVFGAQGPLESLTFISPADNTYSITYGQPVALNVSILQGIIVKSLDIYNSQNLLKSSNQVNSPVLYTAYFACPTSSFQITGLSLDTLYSIVPGGVYGQVVITVTAENLNPATMAITITKPTANIPPAFVLGRMPYYPSVYASMKEDNTVEVLSMEEFLELKENFSNKN